MIPKHVDARTWLRRILTGLSMIAVVMCSAVFLRTCDISHDRRMLAAERTTPEQQAQLAASKDSRRAVNRKLAVLAGVFLLGNLGIIVTFVHASRTRVHKAASPPRRIGRVALALAHGTLALGTAFAILIMVAVIDRVVFPMGGGMFSGEKGMALLFSGFWFLAVWAASSVICAWVIWRRDAP